MALRKYIPAGDAPSVSMKPLNLSSKVHGNAQLADPEASHTVEPDVDIDLREVYFLIMHFLSAGPCQRTYGQFWNELLEHQLLPRRYHAWYSRNGVHSGDENDDGLSFPLSYNKLVERYPHIEKDHLVKLLKQLIISTPSSSRSMMGENAPNAADVPTLLGTGTFSLLSYDRDKGQFEVKHPSAHMRWPHKHADQVRGLSLREIGGGFTRHHRAPSIRAACYAIVKPLTMVQKMQNIKRVRGHRNAVYCATFDRSGRYVITGSDDRLVKIWSMETAYCLASCRGHEGDITDLAVSSNNALVASSSNDCIIRVWRLPDGLPISVLRGHTGVVTAIAFSPRPGSVYQLLSSSDDGTCRIWDARYSQFSPRIYVPRPSDSMAGKNTGPSTSAGPRSHQIFCCAFNANGTVFVTGSSDTLARVWNACKPNMDDSDQPNHEIDVLSGHENDVNYVQFSGCAVASRFSLADNSKEENTPKFKNSWFSHDNIVTCSRDGSAIIWIPRSRRSHPKAARWTQAYHLKVPPPPMPPQPPRGGPRQRILPTPRGVNMIVWSLDNRFVLAAIMDCRICVWNAADGSLVHSLTGHTESTYVLDVHPFNPRIAMSAGYDGKTIVWDIWEGTPIRIYEISRFKLVDGKFSPDGTSIILSDDVGQLYILNTGQGESQQDAKYDQFFLGDYRPLIQDTYGNVLDQETQLAPYRRNMQDPLCDSGMIPYPEPYQTMYQQRRLGALGIEWRPSSLKLTVGPNFSLDQDYQLQPLADLDIIIDPLPEFVDVMDWEPENEVQSDDTDSEYNVPEEYSSGEERGNLSSTSSDDPECSAEDSENEDNQKDGLRRSKRKKQKAEVEIMTSSGRRVKKRNLDECEGNSSRHIRTRKSGNSQKTSRRKSSKSKSLRPQRAAARNARTLFSKITGASTDGEDEDGSEGEISESEGTLQDSNVESEESSRSLVNEQMKHSKGKEISLDESEDAAKLEFPESHVKAGTRRKLVLKLPVRDSNKPKLESAFDKSDRHDDVAGTSSVVPEEAALDNGNHVSPLDQGCCSGDANCSLMERGREQLEKVELHLNLSDGYKNGEIKWGGVRARTSKRLRLGESMLLDANTGSDVHLDNHKAKENEVIGLVKPEENGIDTSSRIETTNCGDKIDEVEITNVESHGFKNCEILGGEANGKEHSGFSEFRDYDESSNWVNMTNGDAAANPVAHQNDSNNHPELEESHLPISTKLRIKSKMISRDAEGPDPSIECGSDALHDSSLDMKWNSVSEVLEYDGANRISTNQGADGLQQLDTQIDSVSRVHDSSGLHSHSKKMFNVVYKRLKTCRDRTNSEGESGGMGESTSNANNTNLHEGTSDRSCRTRSMGLKTSTHDPNMSNNLRLGQQHESQDIYTSAHNKSVNRYQLPCEEWGSGSRMTVGLRSIRNRRSNYHFCDSSPVDKRKAHHSSRKRSWLMLSTYEEGSRYIPQLGDQIVYLRQGHQEYIYYRNSKEVGPWATVKGNIRAVEFCKVEGLDYATTSGSGDSCCKMALKFIDPASSVFNKVFKLTLPEVTGFPDFLVERTRFDAATHRNWTCRDKCKVWWKNEGEEDGSWWDGRILSVKPKSSEFPDSPWERYTVQYKTEPTETHLHSPWELFDADTQWKQPHIDDDSRNKLLSAFAKLEQSAHKVQDQYGVQKLKQVSQKSNFTNRFPVPLSLEVIQSRLEHNYYRSLEAVKHDIAIMLSNAESYFGKNSDLSTKIKCLSDWFERILLSLESSSSGPPETRQ
ncbi:PH-interacting protein [Pistacia vera]|uniref:PH-interacting protein n=1 Tax=Pistacia vera TaxID=55513 RepID=UPI001263B6E6|nr:PH-interacting protein [Pistacia vera]